MSYPFLRDRSIPAFQKQPCADDDQNQRPKSAHAERKPAHVVEQKQTAETNQNDGTNGNAVVATGVVRYWLGIHRRLRRTPGGIYGSRVPRGGSPRRSLPARLVHSRTEHVFQPKGIRQRQTMLDRL